ncbi:MAG: hypothetical protein ACJAT1_000113 [Marivirga sp.]|jgi:hypothetical protein
MKFVKRAFLSILCLPLLFTWGCYSELKDLKFGDVEWSPELALPLFNTTFDMSDLLLELDSTVEYFEEEDRIVLFIEDDSLFSTRASDFYSAPNKTFSSIPVILTPLEINTYNNNGAVTVERQIDVEYTSTLDSISIMEALAKLSIAEDFPADGVFELSIKTKPNNGQAVTILDHTYSWNYDGINQVSNDAHTNLFRDVTFIFQGNEPDNILNISYTLSLTNGNNQNLVFNENRLDIDLRFTSFVFSYLAGDLKTQEITTDKNIIETGFFDDLGDFGDASYYFEAPSFTLFYTNSLGVPAQFNIESFKYFADGVANDINYDSKIFLPKASFNEPSFTAVSFDEQIREVLNAKPESIELAIKGLLDPDSTKDNFIKADSKITIGYNLEIPLELSFSNLNFDQNVAVSNLDPGDTKYAIIYFTSQNELPLDVTLEVVALSADSTVLYQLFDNKILAAGSLGSPNDVLNQVELRDNPNTSINELDFLQETKSIGIRARIATTNNGNEVVKISSKATVTFSASIQTQYTINLSN